MDKPQGPPKDKQGNQERAPKTMRAVVVNKNGEVVSRSVTIVPEPIGTSLVTKL